MRGFAEKKLHMQKFKDVIKYRWGRESAIKQRGDKTTALMAISVSSFITEPDSPKPQS